MNLSSRRRVGHPTDPREKFNAADHTRDTPSRDVPARANACPVKEARNLAETRIPKLWLTQSATKSGGGSAPLVDLSKRCDLRDLPPIQDQVLFMTILAKTGF